jgi:hypothetical protein
MSAMSCDDVDLGDRREKRAYPPRGGCLLSRYRRMSCDDVDLGDPCPLPFHSTQSQSSHFGVAFSSCCPSRSRDQPINRSPDFCPGLVIPSAVEGSAFSSALPISAMSCDDVDLGDPCPLPFHSTRSQSSHFGVAFSSCCPSRSRDQPINRSPDFCLRASVVGVCSPDPGDVAR